MNQKPASYAQAAILVPVYNEGRRFDAFFEKLRAFLERNPRLFHEVHIVIVDDGSDSPVKIPSARPLSAPKITCHLLRHPVNLGQGAALQTGLVYARDYLHCDFFVTLDADGQHDPNELPRFVEKMRADHLSFIFGNRWNENTESTIPLLRKMVLKLAVGFERVVTGIQLKDSHNGFRTFDRQAALQIELKQNKMAYATELTRQIAVKNIPYGEVPMTIVYSEESLAKGQKNLDGLIIIKDLLRNLIFDV